MVLVVLVLLVVVLDVVVLVDVVVLDEVVVLGTVVVVVVLDVVVVLLGAVVVLELVVLDEVVLELVVVDEEVVDEDVVLELVVLEDVVLELVVVDVVGAPVVTTSWGPFVCSRDLMSAPSDPLVFDTTKANVPFPVTTPVTSNSTHDELGSLGSVPTRATLAGAVFQVMPFSVQPVPVVWSEAPWLEPLDPTRRRSLALTIGATSPLVVNFRYDMTLAPVAWSTRSGSLSKLADGRFCSTRASATAAKVNGVVALAAGSGRATATAPAATTTAAMNMRARGPHSAPREGRDKATGPPARKRPSPMAPGQVATVLWIVRFDHRQ